MKTIGIVEDEIIIAASLYSTLKKLNYAPFEPAYSYEAGLELMESKKPDLFLIDINLGGDKTGVDLAKKIKNHYNCPIIFITAYADPKTLEQSFEMNPNAFIVKPVSREQLLASIEIAFNSFEKTTQSKSPPTEPSLITIKDGYKYNTVNLSEIDYIESDRNYVTYYQNNGKKYMERSTLKLVEDKFGDRGFIKINRSYVLNIKNINQMTANQAIIGQKSFKISKNIKSEILKRIEAL